MPAPANRNIPNALQNLLVQQSFTNSTLSYGTMWDDLALQVFYQSRMVGLGLVVEHTGVKDKVAIPKLTVSTTIVADSCNYNAASGTSNLSSNDLVVCTFGAPDEVCPDDFESVLLATGRWKRGEGANDNELQEILMNAWMSKKVNDLTYIAEDLMFNGDTEGTPGPYFPEYLTLCDGWIKKFKADEAVIKLTPGTLSSSTVFAEIKKVWAAIPKEIYTSNVYTKNVYILISQNVHAFLSEAYVEKEGVYGGDMRAGFMMALDANGQPQFRYMGIPIYMIGALPDDTMIATIKDNMHWGTDLQNDWGAFQVVNMNQFDPWNRTIRVNARFRQGVAYSWGAYVIYYGN